MTTTYQRLKYLDQEQRAGRLNAILLSPDGPRALIPALPDMVALIEAVHEVATQAGLRDDVAATLRTALRPLVEDRP